MKRGWLDLIDILPGEGRVVSLLIAHSFFMGLSLIVFETAAIALFLGRFPAESVPYTFIGTAFVVPLSGVVYNSLYNRLFTPQLWAGTLLVLLAVPLAAVGVLQATRSAWPSFVLMVLVIAMYALTALEFWGVAGRVLSLRQARRLYGLIGSGEVAAGILPCGCALAEGRQRDQSASGGAGGVPRLSVVPLRPAAGTARAYRGRGGGRGQD
jgi:ATP:ADP antiporter, AAA family